MKYLTKKLSIVILAFLLLLPSSAWGLQTFRRAIEPESLAQNARILADSGTIIDSFWINITLRTVKDQGVLAAAKFLADANFAVKKDGAGATSTLYDVSGNQNDATQSTGASQPIWTAAQQNGKAGLVFDGSDDYLSFPSGVFSIFAGTDVPSTVISALVNETIAGIIMEIGTLQPLYRPFSAWKRDDAGITTSAGGCLIASVSPVIYSAVSAGTTISTYNNGIVNADGASFDVGVTNISTSMFFGQSYTAAQREGITKLNLLIFSTALSTAQRQAMEILLNSYYQIY